MLIRGKTIQQLAPQDFKDMIGTESESDTLDFKTDFTSGSLDTGREEFCKDIVGFANAFGGVLILGMADVGGIASKITGMKHHSNLEMIQKKMKQIALQDTEPPVQFGLRLVEIDGDFLLLVEVEPSLNKPHSYKAANGKKFAQRNGPQTYGDVSMNAIREMFMSGLRRAESIGDFLKERRTYAAGVRLTRSQSERDGNMHILSIPLTRFKSNWLDLRGKSDVPNFYKISGYNVGTSQVSYNHLGISSYGEVQRAISQIFRDGSVEVVHNLSMRVNNPGFANNYYALDVVEAALFGWLAYTVRTQEALGVNGPLGIFIAFERMEGEFARFDGLTGFYRPSGTGSVPESFTLPDVVIDTLPLHDVEEEFISELGKTIRPSVDVLWNAAGYSGSPNFNADDTWIIQRSR